MTYDKWSDKSNSENYISKLAGLMLTHVHAHTPVIYVNKILVLMYHLNWVQKDYVLKDHFENYSISFLDNK